MGKRSKFNVKGRQQQGTFVVDNSETTKIKINIDDSDLSSISTTKYDESNPLVLPSKKRKTILKRDETKREKILSKKQRKMLAKIVERREKKSNRAELIEELKKYQLPSLITSTDERTKFFSNRNKRKKKNRKEKAAENPIEPRSQVKDEIDDKNLTTSSDDDEDGDASSPEVVEVVELSNGKKDKLDDIKVEEVINEKSTKNRKKKQAELELEQAIPTVKIVPVKIQRHNEPVNRLEEIEKVRSKLPIIAEEQAIIEAINDNLVVILSGETGSGKTTQVPQFLYEAGYTQNGKKIGITEPRRVAAMSMANRVGKELNMSSKIVSFQIRFEGNTTSQTKIKFMTDGVLLKEMEKDFLLTKYSVICIDEAHERSLYTDILIGLLSRCILLRNKKEDPLRLVIMSATMRIDDFAQNSYLFSQKPEIISIPVRQYPVQIHFNKVTPENYLESAIKKVTLIHKKLPPGGILVFVTGQHEVKSFINQLNKKFNRNKILQQQNEEDDEEQFENKKIRKQPKSNEEIKSSKLVSFDLDKVKSFPYSNEHDSDDEFSSDSDNEFGNENEDDDDSGSGPLHLVPLYSMLPIKEQKKVFDLPPEGSRLCVVSTNVAETSLTIPSIRYVVDCGKVKTKIWDKITGVQKFEITWCSKASAEQRSGRAGRTGPGHCYRLYSSAVFDNEFGEYSPPEIQIRPVEDMYLLMKAMHIDQVKNFPFPTPPTEEQLIVAEKLLITLGALEKKQIDGSNKKLLKNRELSKISSLGKTMAHFPIGPRFSKMLSLSFQHSIVEYAIVLVASLSVQEVILYNQDEESKLKLSTIRKKWSGTGQSGLLGDCMVLIKACGAFEYSGGSTEFSMKYGLRYKAMIEIRKLRHQLISEINLLLDEDNEIPLNPKLEPPTEEQAKFLRQIILSGCPDKIAKKISPEEIKEDEDKLKFKHAYRCGELVDLAYIDKTSVLKSVEPEWIVYQDIFEKDGKLYLRNVTAIEPEWIPQLCSSVCKLDGPLKNPPPFYDSNDSLVKCSMKSTYGRQGWELPIIQTEMPSGLDKYKYYAQFLLEGKVFKKLEQFKQNYLSHPSSITKTWANLQPRNQIFLTALTSQQIDSKDKLIKKWEIDDKFLLKEYSDWIPEKLKPQVAELWPPI